MNNLMTVHTLGPQLIGLLGLPKHCISFELVPRATPTAVEPHPAEVIGFDAWMRERNECAHQEMMAAARAAAQRNLFGAALIAATIAHLKSFGIHITDNGLCFKGPIVSGPT